MEWVWVVAAAVVLLGLAVWLSWTAQRLDRMHHRLEVARGSLDAQLLHRENEDELYWNANGNDWSFPIQAASVQVQRARAAAKEAAAPGQHEVAVEEPLEQHIVCGQAHRAQGVHASSSMPTSRSGWRNCDRRLPSNVHVPAGNWVRWYENYRPLIGFGFIAFQTFAGG